jgi:hypothetical protein
LLQTLAGGERIATFTPDGAATIRESFTGHLVAGRNDILCFAPHLPVKTDSLRLLPPPEVRVLHWQDEPALGGRRWAVQVPQEADYRLTVAYDLPQLTACFAYRLDWRRDVAVLQASVSLLNALPQPLELQSVEYHLISKEAAPAGAEASGGARLVMPGPILLRPGTVREQEVGEPMEISGQRVFEFDGGPARERLELTPTPEQIAGLGLLPPGDLTVCWPEAEERPPLAVGALPVPEKGIVTLNLGDSAEVVVKRLMLTQARKDLEFDKQGRVCGFDLVETYRLEVTNCCFAPVRVRLWEIVMAQWELHSQMPLAKQEGGRVAFEVQPGPAETAVVEFTLVKHTGTRASGT